LKRSPKGGGLFEGCLLFLILVWARREAGIKSGKRNGGELPALTEVFWTQRQYSLRLRKAGSGNLSRLAGFWATPATYRMSAFCPKERFALFVFCLRQRI